MFKMLPSLVLASKFFCSSPDALNADHQSDGGELPRAYIVPQTPEKATPEVAEKIKSWLAERVSRAKRLDGGIVFLEAIPKNPSGKILRKELRDRAKAETPKAKL